MIRGKAMCCRPGEVFQDCLGIVADCHESYPLLLEAAFGALQLDQLPLAVGSPVRGTKEKKNGALGSFERVQVLQPAKLIS